MDQLPRLGKRELICLFTCSCVVSVRRGFLFLWVRDIGCVILLWHSLSLPYTYFAENLQVISFKMTCTSSTDEVRVKVSSFQKVAYFLQYTMFHRDVIRLFLFY